MYFNYLIEVVKQSTKSVLASYIIPELEEHHTLVTMLMLLSFAIFLSILFKKKKCKGKGEKPLLDFPSLPRFRKRDKLRYFVNQYRRRLQAVSKKFSKLQSQQEKKQFMSQFAKKILRIKEEERRPVLRRLPASFFEANTDEEEFVSEISDDLKFCLSSVNVFGQLEKCDYLQLFKYVEIVDVKAGGFLFSPGDEDSNLYVVRSGKIQLFYKDPTTNKEYVLNEIGRGGNVHSLLSVMDVLSGSIQPYKTVYARAITESEVVRLSAKSFLQIFENSPYTLLRMIQIIAVRLGRVTFLALYNYLGLSTELLNENMELFYESEVEKIHQRLDISRRLSATKREVSVNPLLTKVKHPPASEWSAISSSQPIEIPQSSPRKNTLNDIKETLSDSPSMRSDSFPSESVSPSFGLPSIKEVLELNSLQNEFMASPRTSRQPASAHRRKVCRSHSPSCLFNSFPAPDHPYAPLVDSLSDSDSNPTRRPQKHKESLKILEMVHDTSDEDDLNLGEATPLHRHFAMDNSELPFRMDSEIQNPISGVIGGVMGRELFSSFSTADIRIKDHLNTSTMGDFSNIETVSTKFDVFHHRLSQKPKESIDPIFLAHSLLGLSEKELSMLLEAAQKDIVKILDLQEPQLLEGKLRLSVVPPHTNLVQQGEQDAGLFLVVAGKIHCFWQLTQDPPSKRTSLYISKIGELLNSLSTVSREPSHFTLRALEPAAVVKIDAALFYQLVHRQTSVALNVVNCFMRRLSPFLRQIDFALEWVTIKAGHSLYKQNDPPHSVYIILHGRLRQIYEDENGEKELVEEMGRGELVGLLEALSHQPRVTTMLAVRDSEVALIPVGLLETIKYRAPYVVGRLVQLLSDRLLCNITGTLGNASVKTGGRLMREMSTSFPGSLKKTNRLVSSGSYSGSDVRFLQGNRLHRSLGNVRTIAILATSYDAPLEPFVLELQHAMNTIGASLRLTSRIILRRLGQKALDSANEYKLCSWLSKQEDTHRILFYICDPHHNTVWTRRCIRQADCVLVVALAQSNPDVVTSLESAVTKDSVKVNRMLALLYPDDVEYPTIGRTAQWLERRPWIQQHFHIRCPRRVFTTYHLSYERLLKKYKRIHEHEKPSPHSDFSRLARYLSDTSVGLVLGGGGARGASHVGVIRGLCEAGIPIDMVCGTSIGSFMGALWAEETRLVQFTQRARAFFKDMSSVWRTLMDLTYPAVAFFSGKHFNSGLEKVFKKRQIEDLWLPYFCITTDITNSQMRIHTEGSLWRYVRASMSLSGYMPPLCDPLDGSLLLDGGYVNNLPADIMYKMGLATIFAVDVGSSDDRNHTNYGDHISGWSLLYSRFFKRSNPIRVPGMTEIQSRLAYVSCVRQLEFVKESGICEYIRPKIELYQTLQFSAFEDIYEVGYKCINEKIDEWRKQGVLRYYQRLSYSERETSQPDGALATTPFDILLSPMNSLAGGSSYGSYRYNVASKSIENGLSKSEFAFNEQRHIIDLAEIVSQIDKKIGYSSEESFSGVTDSDDFQTPLTQYERPKKHKNQIRLTRPKRTMVRSQDTTSLHSHSSENRDSFSSEGGGYEEEDESDDDVTFVPRGHKSSDSIDAVQNASPPTLTFLSSSTVRNSSRNKFHSSARHTHSKFNKRGQSTSSNVNGRRFKDFEVRHLWDEMNNPDAGPGIIASDSELMETSALTDGHISNSRLHSHRGIELLRLFSDGVLRNPSKWNSQSSISSQSKTSPKKIRREQS